MTCFGEGGPIRHKSPEHASNDRVDGTVESRVFGKLQGRGSDWQGAIIFRQQKTALGLAHYFKSDRQSVREMNRKVIERRFFAGFQFQSNFRQWLPSVAGKNKPFIEGNFDQGTCEIET